MQHPVMAHHAERGSVVIVLVAVLALFGAIVMFSGQVSDIDNEKNAIANTERDMERIADQIATYVQLNNRLPCPHFAASTGESAANFGQESRSGASCLVNSGVLPWRTLGLPDSMSKDSWKNFYSYNISPAFTNVTEPATFRENIFNHCRNSSWVGRSAHASGNGAVDTSVPTQGWQNFWQNINVPKARFCCPSARAGGIFAPAADNDLVVAIAGTVGSPTFYDPATTSGGIHRTNIAGNSGNVHLLATPDENDSAAAVAYVLVSHGPNGYGALLGNGSNRVAFPSSASAEEQANANPATLTYFALGRGNALGDRLFDDLVLFRSQQQTMGEIGGGSCRLPY